MKYKILIIVLFFGTGLSCQNTSYLNQSCKTKNFKKRVIESILMNESVKDYLHVDVEKMKPITLYNNKSVKGLKLFYKNNKIVFTNNVSTENLIIFSFMKYDCKNKKIEFSIIFKGENSVIEGYIKNSNNLDIVITKEVEF